MIWTQKEWKLNNIIDDRYGTTSLQNSICVNANKLVCSGGFLAAVVVVE